MPYSEPIPVEDAIAIERHHDGSRTYSDVLQAAASKAPGIMWAGLTAAINGLYAGGYALVKVRGRRDVRPDHQRGAGRRRRLGRPPRRPGPHVEPLLREAR